MRLDERVDRLEAAVIALGTQELGDSAGHDFYGNQWTSGGGNRGNVRSEGKAAEARAARRERVKGMSSAERERLHEEVAKLKGKAGGNSPQREAARDDIARPLTRAEERRIYGNKSVSQHVDEAEKRVDEAAKDLDMDPDVIANDVWHSYIDGEVPPSQRDDVMRRLGIDRRYPAPSLDDEDEITMMRPAAWKYGAIG